MTAKTPSPDTLAVLADWPGSEWVTEAELAEHLPKHHGVVVTTDGFRLASGRGLRGVLNEARRSGCLIRNQRFSPPVYLRTDQGALTAGAALEEVVS